MQDILLAKLDHAPGTIDLTVGEPRVVRDALFAVIDPDTIKVTPTDSHFWEYQKPNGYAPLVQLLEARHGRKVVVTNGAKQGLAAFFYAMNRLGKRDVGMKLPYWALVPPLARSLGCNPLYEEPSSKASYDGFLLLAPNNPDGQCATPEELWRLSGSHKDSNKIFVHDAAYYTHSYLPEDYELRELGDAQIWSVSKMLGLSSLRVGYVTCDNEEMYRLMCEYVETFTVGVSVLSQELCYKVLKHFYDNPLAQKEFESRCRSALHRSRQIASQFNTNILRNASPSVTGMFGWYQVLDERTLVASGVKGIAGELFGMPGHVRFNLAVDERTLAEASERLSARP